LFDSIPYKDQAIGLVKYIDSSDEHKKMTGTLADAYKAQDLNKIEELTIREDPATTSYMDLLLYGRNRKWVNKMKQLLPEKSLLFAVGAGHLVLHVRQLLLSASLPVIATPPQYSFFHLTKWMCRKNQWRLKSA
jgi:hypothetical protein